jgi:hypothetical protein
MRIGLEFLRERIGEPRKPAHPHPLPDRLFVWRATDLAGLKINRFDQRGILGWRPATVDALRHRPS